MGRPTARRARVSSHARGGGAGGRGALTPSSMSLNGSNGERMPRGSPPTKGSPGNPTMTFRLDGESPPPPPRAWCMCGDLTAPSTTDAGAAVGGVDAGAAVGGVDGVALAAAPVVGVTADDGRGVTTAGAASASVLVPAAESSLRVPSTPAPWLLPGAPSAAAGRASGVVGASASAAAAAASSALGCVTGTRTLGGGAGCSKLGPAPALRASSMEDTALPGRRSSTRRGGSGAGSARARAPPLAAKRSTAGTRRACAGKAPAPSASGAAGGASTPGSGCASSATGESDAGNVSGVPPPRSEGVAASRVSAGVEGGAACNPLPAAAIWAPTRT